MRKQSSRLMVVLSLLVVGCAPTQPVANVDQSPLRAGRAYAKILVLGTQADAERRRLFENDVVAAFDAQGVSAVSTLATLGTGQALNRDVLAAAAHDTGSDAVLITRLLDAQRSGESPGGGTTARGQGRNDQPLDDFFRHEYVDDGDPMAASTVLTVLVASDLYDVASENRVWSAQSTAFTKDNVDAAIAGVAESVTRSLRAGGWLD